ncbi:leucine-rich repeat flightless-interacting protein 1 isoform X32 [Phascolarctos cinereus]|uniref:Leucine-rich repeat flightless-interacting protein 1 isoform X32 n=1 Tax=Phascolarctos cinereus TaxID=38626 RepID=A0A6P5J9R6_PHACI|nr:leucine-rich repeat flightless-interacting protein 1 isoform X32 [Phascolarctos cinereus]
MEMGTQGSGRRRLPQRERLTAEDDALSQIAREAEARLAAKRAARAEAREIRMKELERQQKEVEERPEKDFAEKGSRNMPSLSAATLASLGGTSSRRGSGDTSISVDTEASMREIKEINELKDQIQDVEGKYMQGLKEMKDSLAEVEEKYKKAMVSNAQLDNEKTNFMYQVDTLKDALLELEEQLVESRRQYEEKNKEFERQKHAHSVLQFQFAEAKEALKQREEMLAEIRQLQQKQESYIREISDLQETIEWKDKKIGALERQKEYFDSIRSERDELRAEAILLKEELKKHGIILNSEITTNGEPLDNLSNMSHLGSPKVLQQETNVIKSSSDGTLDIRLKNLVDERECLLEQIKKLKGQLEERQKNGQLENLRSEDDILENGTDIHVLDLQRDANRQISDLKFKLAKSEQEITALEQNVIRLEGQVSRYRSAAENAERVEDELKAEKRKLQRELRSALDKTEELEVSNSHLVKRLEKMKANRSALLSQQ